MKTILGAAAIAVLGFGVGAAPSQAQSGGYMWCSATSTNGNSVGRYYSGVFSASATEAATKAAAFKSEAEEAEISAAVIAATCYAAPDQQSALRALNAARNNAPGVALDWAG
jgi:hypothetical protein